MRAPPAGRPTPELAGDRPKKRRAPSRELDRPPLFFNLDRSLACVCLGPYMVLEISSPSLPSACWRSWYDGVPLWPISGGGAQHTLVCGTSCFHWLSSNLGRPHHLDGRTYTSAPASSKHDLFASGSRKN